MGKAQDNVKADYATHLRPYGKRSFWKRVRAALKEFMKNEEAEKTR